jgi:orotidine-5'-phosphate decarboxylase
VAYKPNLAFYESMGTTGWISLEKTFNYIKLNHPEVLIIADGKRCDIGHTSRKYAKAFFETCGVDALTIAPYMGRDSVEPFLQYKQKWAILLALTSNEGSEDFQMLTDASSNEPVYKQVLRKSAAWGNVENMMYVIGATKAEMLAEVRKIVPEHFLLVPGVGAQGGSLAEVAKHGLNDNIGLLVNASRSIIYASVGKNFAVAARDQATKLQKEMAVYVK